jgi:hypothetical protein
LFSSWFFYFFQIGGVSILDDLSSRQASILALLMKEEELKRRLEFAVSTPVIETLRAEIYICRSARILLLFD